MSLFYVFFIWGEGGSELSVEKRSNCFLIKLLVITLQLKIVNERTSVAFDDTSLFVLHVSMTLMFRAKA